MRGGAIPLIAWGTLLLVLFIGNWIWNDKGVPAAEAALAALIIYAGALALWLARHESVRRGPPPPRTRIEASPTMSLGAALAGIAVGSILFGLVWAQFLFIFGIGLLIAAVGRLVLEFRSERSSRRTMVEQARAARGPSVPATPPHDAAAAPPAGEEARR